MPASPTPFSNRILLCVAMLTVVSALAEHLSTSRFTGRLAAAELPTDWSEFRGPNRENKSTSTGLMKAWPDSGPRLEWTATGLGEGYSSVVLVGDRIFTMGNVDGAEQIIALDRTDGSRIWMQRNGSEYHDGTGNGPRGTPTVANGLVYALGGNGDLSCCDVETGNIVWTMNILKEFGGRNITWGISESVLVDEGKVICTPGGDKGTVVAIDAKNGRTVWTSAVPTSPQAAYASPIVATIKGVRQYVVFTSNGVAGIRATDGKPMWGEDAASNGTANCATPLLIGDRVLSSSDYGTGAALVSLNSSRGITTSNRVWFTKAMKNHHGGMFEHNGYVYGSSSDILTCLNVRDGKAVWQQRSMKGSVVYADGLFVFRHENGPVYLVEATPEGFSQKGRFDQPNRSGRPAWSHPVIVDGRLYLRDQDKLLVYNLLE